MMRNEPTTIRISPLAICAPLGLASMGMFMSRIQTLPMGDHLAYHTKPITMLASRASTRPSQLMPLKLKDVGFIGSRCPDGAVANPRRVYSSEQFRFP